MALGFPLLPRGRLTTEEVWGTGVGRPRRSILEQNRLANPKGELMQSSPWKGEENIGGVVTYAKLSITWRGKVIAPGILTYAKNY